MKDTPYRRGIGRSSDETVIQHRSRTNAGNAKAIAIVVGFGVSMAACAGLLSAAKADPIAAPNEAVTALGPDFLVHKPIQSGAPDELAELIASLNRAVSGWAPIGSASNPIPLDSPTPAELAHRLVAGDPSVVTNGPIPDTPSNRAIHGPPNSRAGRASAPDGN